MQPNYNDLEKRAREKEDENWKFRSFLKFHNDIPDKEIDAMVFRIADKIGSTVECTDCGRCCKELKPTLSQKDQERLADKLAMTVEQLREKHLEYDKADGEPRWQIKVVPCPF